MHNFAKRSLQSTRGGWSLCKCGVVLIHCLPADTPYILDHVVDRGCDTPVESFVVHSLNIGLQVGCGYKGRQAMFLIFLSNIPYVYI